jgi:hypothetical protein
LPQISPRFAPLRKEGCLSPAEKKPNCLDFILDSIGNTHFQAIISPFNLSLPYTAWILFSPDVFFSAIFLNLELIIFIQNSLD